MKHLPIPRFLVVSAVCLLASSLQAQLSINPNPVTSGQQATISYNSPSHAGKNITITIGGGVPATLVIIEVLVDANGKAKVNWTPPAGWTSAYINAPGCSELRVEVN